MKVSIVTINKNNAAGLRLSLLSYFDQDISECELIVVDGNSEDASLSVLDEFKDKIDKVIVEFDKGIFDAMNKGIEVCNSDFTYFLNSGDVFFDSATLKQVKSALLSIDCVYYGDVKFHLNGKNVDRRNNGSTWIVHQSTFTPTNLLKEIRFNPDLKVFGDAYFWRELARRGVPLVKFEILIACMDLEGVGSDPSKLKLKLRDKNRIFRETREFRPYIFSIINLILAYMIYLVLGKRFVILRWSEFVNSLKSWMIKF